MTRRRSSLAPSEVTAGLTEMGQAIRAARLRRRQPAADLAARIGISLPTLRKLERGEPSVSLGAFATAIWVLGLLPAVRDAVMPESDRLAAAIEVSRLPRRARRPKDVDLDDL